MSLESLRYSYDLHFRLGKVMPSGVEQHFVTGIDSALVLLDSTVKQGDMQCADLAVGAIEQLKTLRLQFTSTNRRFRGIWDWEMWIRSHKGAKDMLSEVNKAQADIKKKVERLYFARLVFPIGFLFLLIGSTFGVVPLPLLFLAFYGLIVDGWLKDMLVKTEEAKETIAFIARVANFIQIAAAAAKPTGEPVPY